MIIVCCQCWHRKPFESASDLAFWQGWTLWTLKDYLCSNAFGFPKKMESDLILKAIVTLMAWNKSSYPSIYNKVPITAHFNMQHPQNASLSCQPTIAHWIPDWGDCKVLSKMFFIYTPAPSLAGKLAEGLMRWWMQKHVAKHTAIRHIL